MSFEIDHTRLECGIYVSRVDTMKDCSVTTYDIRVCVPNKESMNPMGAHTIEHLGATLLREGEHGDRVVYFGPMGCMTGFYLILKGAPDVELASAMVKRAFETISRWVDDIPGASAKECGNHTYHCLSYAKLIAREFIKRPWKHEYPK